jgi:iron complex transport system substrate-binding protein
VSIRRFAALLALAALVGAAPARTRIVVLVPSLAEDAVAIGAGAQVVGVSRYTNDVPGVAGAAIVADFQSVDTEKIVALAPDAVIGIPSQARLTAQLAHAGIRVILMPDDSYDDIFTDIRRIGEVTGHAPAANRLILRLQRETQALHASVMRRKYHPSVFITLGTGPIWTAGAPSYLSRLIELAGGRNAADDLSVPWGAYSEEALLHAQPDAIVSGYETNLRDVENREPWRSLHAVREGHVCVITDQRIANALFRPGPRYIEGLRWLIARLSSLSTPKTRSDR